MEHTLPVVRPVPLLLVAEDDGAMRGLLAEGLVRRGFRVETAPDGEAALRRLLGTHAGSETPALLVTDIRLPLLDGLSLLAALRAYLRKLPVVVITGFGDQQARTRAARLGACAFFEKPFDLDDLARAIQRGISVHN